MRYRIKQWNESRFTIQHSIAIFFPWYDRGLIFETLKSARETLVFDLTAAKKKSEYPKYYRYSQRRGILLSPPTTLAGKILDVLMLTNR